MNLNFSDDSLTLYDGNSNSAPLIRELCGQSLPPSLVTSSNEAFLEFKAYYRDLHFNSNDYFGDIRFKLEYHSTCKLYLFNCCL